MGLTKISGEVIQTPLNVGVVTATRIDGDVNGNVNSTGVSTFSTLKVGTTVNINGGIVTATTFSGNLTGNVTGNATGLSGTPNITVGGITASSATITGNVSVAGTVTYEDVTNVDSIGVITARSGINVTGGAIISGVTTVSAGSTASPSISPTGDSNTGIFFPAPDTVVIGEGGVEVLRINSSGNIGIGTINPQVKLEVKQSSLRQGIRVQHENNDSTLRLYIDSSNSTAGINASYVSTGSYLPLTFLTSDTERLRITSSGNVGIGLTNPTELLHIAGSILSTGNITGTGLFSTGSFNFNGGGTQTIFAVDRGSTYLVFSQLVNYSGADTRHGIFGIASRTSYGNDVTTYAQIAALTGSGVFSISGANLQYNAGGGNPQTLIYWLRVCKAN